MVNINMETVKVAAGIAGKIIADKGVDIIVKNATQGLESNGQKIAVWVAKVTAGKIVGDKVYKDCTGREFNDDCVKFVNKYIKVPEKKEKSSNEEGAQVEIA